MNTIMIRLFRSNMKNKNVGLLKYCTMPEFDKVFFTKDIRLSVNC